MALVFPNVGEQIALEALVNKTAPQTLMLRLYSNDYTCVEGSTHTNFTEVSGGGYAAISLTPGTWNAATLGDPTYITYPEQTFTFTSVPGIATVYGYFLTQTSSGTLVWAERFATLITIVNAGDAIKLTPRIEAS